MEVGTAASEAPPELQAGGLGSRLVAAQGSHGLALDS